MTIENLRPILELLYFASGPLLAIAAFIGLRRLTLTKKNAKINARREAYAIAASQVQRYLETIIPLQNKLYVKIQELDIRLFLDSKVDISKEGIKLITQLV